MPYLIHQWHQDLGSIVENAQEPCQRPSVVAADGRSIEELRLP